MDEELRQTILLVAEVGDRLDQLEEDSKTNLEVLSAEFKALYERFNELSDASNELAGTETDHITKLKTRWEYIYQTRCIIQAEMDILDLRDKDRRNAQIRVPIWVENQNQRIGLCTRCRHSTMFSMKSFDGGDFQTAQCNFLQGKLMGVTGCEFAIKDPTFELISKFDVEQKLVALNAQNNIVRHHVAGTDTEVWALTDRK